ncbi:MAG TPA: hypothetical protein VNT25_06855 [Allosphingosinicella sp.]|nr:hypothetical protein [Allosphingosinicella sp.]
MTDNPARPIQRAQAAIFALLAFLSLTPYVLPHSTIRITLVGPLAGVAISWVLMSIAALFIERSWRVMSFIYASHFIGFGLMLALVIGANRGFWPRLIVPAIWCLCLAAIAGCNYHASRGPANENRAS